MYWRSCRACSPHFAESAAGSNLAGFDPAKKALAEYSHPNRSTSQTRRWTKVKPEIAALGDVATSMWGFFFCTVHFKFVHNCHCCRVVCEGLQGYWRGGARFVPAKDSAKQGELLSRSDCALGSLPNTRSILEPQTPAEREVAQSSCSFQSLKCVPYFRVTTDSESQSPKNVSLCRT